VTQVRTDLPFSPRLKSALKLFVAKYL